MAISERDPERPPAESSAESASVDATAATELDRPGAAWRARWWILNVALVVAALTYLTSLIITPTFEATALVRVSSQSTISQTSVEASNGLASQYAALIDSQPVARRSERLLGLDAGGLSGAISGGTRSEQNLITVGARGPSSQDAIRRANVVARVLVTNVQTVNAEQAEAYAERIRRQLAPLDRRIGEAEAEVERLILLVTAAGPGTADSLTSLLVARQNGLSSLIAERDRVESNVAESSVAIQPSITVWAAAQSASRIEPRPVLYSIVAFALAAIVAASAAATFAGRRGTGAAST